MWQLYHNSYQICVSKYSQAASNVRSNTASTPLIPIWFRVQKLISLRFRVNSVILEPRTTPKCVFASALDRYRSKWRSLFIRLKAYYLNKRRMLVFSSMSLWRNNDIFENFRNFFGSAVVACWRTADSVLRTRNGTVTFHFSICMINYCWNIMAILSSYYLFKEI